MTNNKVFNFYVFAYLLLFMQSMHVWFLWGDLFKIACPIFFLLVAYLNRLKNPSCYSSYAQSKNKILLAIFVFIALQGSYDAGILSICKSLVGVAALYEIVTLSEDTCTKLLAVLTKTFGLISVVSLVGWLFFLVGFPLPNSNIVDLEFGYTFDNYYVFLYNQLGPIPRFCSVFLEPGYYGQLAAVILFANRMRLNNVYTFTIFIANLFSLSLAGYVLVVLGFVFSNVNKRNLWKLIILTCLGYGSFLFIKSYNGGSNPINEFIFARLEVEDGKLVGDDRSTKELDAYLHNGLIKNGKFLFGHGSEFSKMDWGHGVAGYKAYIVENGYVGLVLAIVAYVILLFRRSQANMMMKSCLFLFMLMYWQAAYPFWLGFFSIYVFSLANLRKYV